MIFESIKKAASPYLTYIKIAVVVAVAVAFYLMYLQVQGLKAQNEKLNKTIGKHEVTIAQLEQNIIDAEADKAKVKREKEIAQEALLEAQNEKQKLAEKNQSQKLEIARLKRENQEAKDYLNTVVPSAVVGLLRNGTDQGYIDQDGICRATTGGISANACTPYATESITRYALDLEQALDSCNADKIAGLNWWNKVKAMNDE